MPNQLPLDAIIIDHKCKTPLYRQLYEFIRQAIINDLFSENSKLPSSRQLSNELNIARSTVTTAYDQLIAEGYLVSKRGSGTSVAKALIKIGKVTQAIEKEDFEEALNSTQLRSELCSQLSHIAQHYCDDSIQSRIRTNYKQTTLMPGIPSRHNFPNIIWGRLLGKYAKQPLKLDAGYDYPSGIPQLKSAIANYIRLARGVNTQESDILIISSTQAALDLLCRTLLNKGDTTWIEEPGYRGAHIAMNNSQANIQGIPVDKEGITLSATSAIPKLIYTSPSHQYPTGVTMSYARRIALLDYAQQHQSWILEDDYDSEFRYRSKPLPSLQGLDQNQRVIYLGTFSKSLSPSMRVAYIVAPPALSSILKSLLGDIGAGINIAVQYALAEFIERGHYSQHIRKTRKEYATKQQVLSKAINDHLSNMVDFTQSNAGLQATLYFKQDYFETKVLDTKLVELATNENLFLRPLSTLYHSTPTRQGLVLGFAACENNEIEKAIIKLAKIMATSKNIPSL